MRFCVDTAGAPSAAAQKYSMPQIGSSNNEQGHQAVLQRPTLGVLQKLRRPVLAGALGALASTAVGIGAPRANR